MAEGSNGRENVRICILFSLTQHWTLMAYLEVKKNTAINEKFLKKNNIAESEERE